LDFWIIILESEETDIFVLGCCWSIFFVDSVQFPLWICIDVGFSIVLSFVVSTLVSDTFPESDIIFMTISIASFIFITTIVSVGIGVFSAIVVCVAVIVVLSALAGIITSKSSITTTQKKLCMFYLRVIAAIRNATHASPTRIPIEFAFSFVTKF